MIRNLYSELSVPMHIVDFKLRLGISELKVEGLMLDIAAAEEEISRWKAAAEQEAAAGRAVEQEFVAQVCFLSCLRREQYFLLIS